MKSSTNKKLLRKKFDINWTGGDEFYIIIASDLKEFVTISNVAIVACSQRKFQ